MKKNQIYAAALIAIGVITTLLGHDCTALLLFGFIAVPMFFSKEEWVY